MFLSVFFKGKWRYSENPGETSRLVVDVMDGLRGEEETVGSYFPGEDAWFCLAERRGVDAEATASNLRVAVNRRSGYGALIWFVDQQFPRKGGVYGSVWVSDNPEPVDFDPRVVSDPGYPLFHDRSSALPVSQVKAAVAEFCGALSGDRPECVTWVAGQMNGQRLDRPPVVDVVEDPEIDWDSIR